MKMTGNTKATLIGKQMSVRCWLFGHAFVDGFKYRRCLRCGLTQRRVLKGIEKELDNNAKIILELETDYLIQKSQYENNQLWMPNQDAYERIMGSWNMGSTVHPL